MLNFVHQIVVPIHVLVPIPVEDVDAQYDVDVQYDVEHDLHDVQHDVDNVQLHNLLPENTSQYNNWLKIKNIFSQYFYTI